MLDIILGRKHWYDQRPSHAYNVGTEHVGFSSTRKGRRRGCEEGGDSKEKKWVGRKRHGKVVQNKKSGIAKFRYTLSLLCQNQQHTKNRYKSHARSPAIGQPHIVPVFDLNLGTSGFVYFV